MGKLPLICVCVFVSIIILICHRIYHNIWLIRFLMVAWLFDLMEYIRSVILHMWKVNNNQRQYQFSKTSQAYCYYLISLSVKYDPILCSVLINKCQYNSYFMYTIWGALWCIMLYTHIVIINILMMMSILKIYFYDAMVSK